MAFLDAVYKFFGGQNLTLKRPDGWPGEGVPWEPEATINDLSSLKSSAYFSSLVVRINTVSILPKSVHIRTDTGSQKDRNHDQYYLINKRANPYQSSSSFFKEFSFNKMHRGNGAAWLEGVDSRSGRPTAYWNLDSRSAYLEVEFQGGDLMWRYKKKLVDGRMLNEWRPYRELLHVPDDIGIGGQMGGVWGRARWKFAEDAIKLDLVAEQSTTQFLKKSGIMKDYFKHPEHLDGKKRTDIANSLKEYGPGQKRQDQRPLLHGGMSIESLNANLDDIDLHSLRTMSVENSARFMTFPALFKIAHHDRSNFANAYQAAVEFVTTTMLPITQALQEELDYKVLKTSEQMQDTHFVNFEYKTLLQAEPDKQANFLRAIFNMGAVTPNEVAKTLDMPTQGEEGDKTYMMNNLIPTELVDEYWQKLINKASQMTPQEAAKIIEETKAFSTNGVH